MKVLFDHNVPKRFGRLIPGHEVRTARQTGFEKLENGALLKAAAEAGFDVFISIDKKIEHEQNPRTLPKAVVILDAWSNTLPAVAPFAPFILELLKPGIERMLFVVEKSGLVHRLTAPR